MERSESGDEQAIEDDCGTMKPDAAEETYDNYNVGLLEECASVHGAGTQQPATEQPKKSSENDDVIVCISDSDSEDSILEVASDEQVFSNSDEVDNEQEEEKESENSSEEAQEEDSDVSFDSSEESRTQDSEVVCLDSPDEEPPAQDSDESKDSLNPDFWKCIENSNDEEVSKPTTFGGVSFDLTGDSSDEETNPTVADKSTGDLLSGAASEQVAVSNDVKESMKELPAESSVEAAESQLPNEKKNTPVPSGDNAEQQRDSAQSTKNADMGRVVPYIGTTGGDISDGNSTAVMKYRSPTLANTSGSIMYRQSGLPFCRRNEMHYLDKLLSAVYPKFHTEPVYTKTRGGYEYTRLLQLYSRKKRKTKRAGASSNSRDVILRSPFYEGPTRYGGASALRSSRDSRMLQVPLPVRQSANQYQLTTPLLSSTSQSLQNSPPDEPNEPRQSTTRTNESFLRARSWNTPYTIARRPRFPMKELVIPTVGELLQYKRQMQINDKPHELEEVRDPDTEMDTSENTSSAYVVASNIQTPSPADTVSTAGKSDSKQITKIKPAVTRTRPSTATSGSDLFAPAPRLELPNVALPGLTSLPKLDLPPEFCFGPGSSQPAWKMMNSVNSSAEKQQQQQQHHLPLATVPPSISFQFIHPEILGSWTLDDMNLISLDRQFDFVGPVSLETDSVLGSEISIQSDSGPSTKLVPFAQLPKTGAGKWECPTCMVFNEQTINRCVACDCPQPRAKEVAGSSAMTPNQSSAATSASFYDSSRSTKLVPFAQLPKTGAGKWECPTCMVFNEQTINRCVACDCPQPRAKEVAGSSAMTPNQSSAATSASFYDSSRPTKLVPFAQLPKTGAGKWECPTCMVFNEQTINRCVACDCPQPRAKEVAGSSAMTPNQSSAATSASFYDSSRSTKLVPFAQLPKTGAGKWECPTCMVFNEQTINRCVACDCPQPRAKEVAGSSAMTGNQWEYSKCRTRYDEAEMKNACCEQPKPSTSKQPVVVSSETPEQTVAYAPLTLSPAGFERMPVATAEMKESNHIFSKCTFVAPTEGTFGNAGKFTADSRTANQTNLGNTSAIRTLPTVPHSSITPIGVTGFSIAPVFKFGDPSIQNPSVATEQLPHLVECGLGGIDGMHGMRRVTSVKRVNFAEGDRWAAM
ncbi:nuclear pore complex protein Nup153 isoform X3 [Anopheles aquasalis]|uniref:nuclear pore complex protein Nup153 isoform X3 n=1 Tax=Anopheles aquasalis TaxID=42839 RepID=UPI00215ADB76|nr:nuclear pore complex protein Nup153 isoform X3 [Anopheles aquasalis]XP_050100336.1 nuclear pore complex protein Nup153 isoform X3 [Anopheles aquasalis]